MVDNQLIIADCLAWMREQPDNSVDLTFGSPPYEDARTYGVEYKIAGREWVAWMADRMVEMVRITKGLVAMVVEGRTRKFAYSATPILLMAELVDRGITLRKPPIFHRVGIPGSGGPDWLRNDYEFIVCATSGGKLPWSASTAMGKPPKYAPGGALSYRTQDGRRINERKHNRGSKARKRTPPEAARRNGGYSPPKLANPGNVIHCKVGGGHMGHPLAAENEAPFPERLAEFFIRSFCPPGGVVLDPFCGSGTTCAVASKCGRQYVGVDIRPEAGGVGTARRRLESVEAQGQLFE